MNLQNFYDRLQMYCFINYSDNLGIKQSISGKLPYIQELQIGHFKYYDSFNVKKPIYISINIHSLLDNKYTPNIF